MFRRKVETLDEVLNLLLRNEGLETPLLQRRLINAWEGDIVAKYTREKFIKNQTLFVKIINPSLKADLSMMKTDIVKKLNGYVGAMIIVDIKFC